VVGAGFGLNEAVTPAGKPEAVNMTLPVKPFVAPQQPCSWQSFLDDACTGRRSRERKRGFWQRLPIVD